MPIIIPANSAVAGGYDVDNSCRFNPSSSDYLSRTNGTPTNAKKFTWSAWFKKTTGAMNVAGNKYDTSNYAYFYFRGTDDLRFFDRSGGADTVWVSDMLFRDTSAWYHLVISVDTTQGTNTNRFKVYVNGVQDTGNGITYPGLNADMAFNKATASGLSRIATNQDTGSFFNGYMSEIVYIDGQQLDPTSFGEFDEDSGIWKPIDVSGLTFGNNGFYLDFENSGALGADVSGNSNNFTVNNLTAIDQTTDTCTNNFATWNPLIYSPETLVFTEGNTNASNQPVGAQYHGSTTIGMTSGKWYAEFKCTAANQYGYVGISASPSETARSDRVPGYYPDEYTLYSYNGYLKTNNGGTSFAASFTSNNDIIGVAVDLDNNKLYFSKNGDWATGSGAWGNSTFNAGTGAKAITASNLTTEQAYFFIIGDADEGSSAKFNGNFGNPSYSTGTNQDSNDRGSFAYAVPSGFFSVCTSNISEALS